MEPDTAEVTRWALSKAIMIGALVGSLLWTALIFRLPGLREFLFKKVGGFRWFGKFQMFKPMIFSFILVALTGAVVACEPTVTGSFDVTVSVPFCPTSDSLYFAADSVPLGCPIPALMGTNLHAPILVGGDGLWLLE